MSTPQTRRRGSCGHFVHELDPHEKCRGCRGCEWDKAPCDLCATVSPHTKGKIEAGTEISLRRIAQRQQKRAAGSPASSKASEKSPKKQKSAGKRKKKSEKATSESSKMAAHRGSLMEISKETPPSQGKAGAAVIPEWAKDMEKRLFAAIGLSMRPPGDAPPIPATKFVVRSPPSKIPGITPLGREGAAPSFAVRSSAGLVCPLGSPSKVNATPAAWSSPFPSEQNAPLSGPGLFADLPSAWDAAGLLEPASSAPLGDEASALDTFAVVTDEPLEVNASPTSLHEDTPARRRDDAELRAGHRGGRLVTPGRLDVDVSDGARPRTDHRGDAKRRDDDFRRGRQSSPRRSRVSRSPSVPRHSTDCRRDGRSRSPYRVRAPTASRRSPVGRRSWDRHRDGESGRSDVRDSGDNVRDDTFRRNGIRDRDFRRDDVRDSGVHRDGVRDSGVRRDDVHDNTSRRDDVRDRVFSWNDDRDGGDVSWASGGRGPRGNRSDEGQRPFNPFTVRRPVVPRSPPSAALGRAVDQGVSFQVSPSLAADASGGTEDPDLDVGMDAVVPLVYTVLDRQFVARHVEPDKGSGPQLNLGVAVQFRERAERPRQFLPQALCTLNSLYTYGGALVGDGSKLDPDADEIDRPTNSAMARSIFRLSGTGYPDTRLTKTHPDTEFVAPSVALDADSNLREPPSFNLPQADVLTDDRMLRHGIRLQSSAAVLHAAMFTAVEKIRTATNPQEMELFLGQALLFGRKACVFETHSHHVFLRMMCNTMLRRRDAVLAPAPISEALKGQLRSLPFHSTAYLFRNSVKKIAPTLPQTVVQAVRRPNLPANRGRSFRGRGAGPPRQPARGGQQQGQGRGARRFPQQPRQDRRPSKSPRGLPRPAK